MSGVDSGPDAFHLRAEGLRKSFAGNEVLHGVDLDAHGGRVLALLGENGAGKSTTIRILAGDYRRDAGRILVNGEEVALSTPAEAEAAGVKVIFQEFMDAPELTVAENIGLGHLDHRLGWVRWGSVRRQAREILDQLGVDIPVEAIVSTLSVAQRQILEIARALVADARLLILDEPTSALAADEVANLFTFIRRLRERGVAIIYITHRLDEVVQIADDVIVFRDGDVVTSGPANEFAAADLIHAMVGEQLEELVVDGAGPVAPATRRSASATDRDRVARVDGASITGIVEDVSFSVAAGQIVCLFGRLGCGALELAEAMFGLRMLDGGTMEIAGRTGQPTSPRDAIRRGVGFVPVDRKTQGILAGLTVAENLSVATWSLRALGRLVLPSTVGAAYSRWSDTLHISARQGAAQPIETLSGGNQQKVVLGRWLERESRLLVLAEPTRGVDVGARAEIYRVLHELAATGIGIVVISSDMDEVLRIGDEVVVLSRGRVTRRLERSELDRSALAHAAAMQLSA